MTLIAMALAAGVALASGAPAAPTRLLDGASMARLAVPATQPVEKLIDGRDWSCTGEVCTAGRQDLADSMPLWMECGDAANELGTFTEYRTGSDTLESDKLVRCNAHAKVTPPTLILRARK